MRSSRWNPAHHRAGHRYRYRTPRWCEQVPRKCAEQLYVPSSHFAVAERGRGDAIRHVPVVRGAHILVAARADGATVTRVSQSAGDGQAREPGADATSGSIPGGPWGPVTGT